MTYTDWLVELAAQRDDEDDTAAASEDAPVGADEAAADNVQSEWDFLRPSPVVTPAEASAAEGLQTEVRQTRASLLRNQMTGMPLSAV